MNPDLSSLLATHHVIQRIQYPSFRSRIDRALREGSLTAVLPGIYALSEFRQDPCTHVLAACLADPNGFVFGEAAMWLHSRMRTTPPKTINFSSQTLKSRDWLRVSRISAPPELLIHDDAVAIAHPLLVALQRAERTEGVSIDDALREGHTLEDLRWALDLMAHHKGMRMARRYLHEARDIPWSPAERRCHVLLRKARITEWKSNLEVRDHNGFIIGYLDIGFRRHKLGLEIDGARWHLRPDQVIRDRERDQRLSALGWTIVRFGAAQLSDGETFINQIRELLRAHPPVF